MHLQYSVSLLFGLFMFCSGGQLDDSKNARILKFDYDDSGKGPYRFGYETSNGISREESSEVHYPGTKHEFLKVTGMFAYPGPDGVMYEVRYTADDQGFHPEGDHIKVPPFVPWIHHHSEDGSDGSDNNNIPDSGTDQQVINFVQTTARPSTEYLPSSTPTSTTYLPPTSSTPQPEYSSSNVNSIGIKSGNFAHSKAVPDGFAKSSNIDTLFTSRLNSVLPSDVNNLRSNVDNTQMFLQNLGTTPNPIMLPQPTLLDSLKSSPLMALVSNPQILKDLSPNAPITPVIIMPNMVLSSIQNNSPNQQLISGELLLEGLKSVNAAHEQVQSKSNILDILKASPIASPPPGSQDLKGDNILEQLRTASAVNSMCLQTLACRYTEPNLGSEGSAPRTNIIYLPSSTARPNIDNSLEDNILSTPKPNPELYFHSTAESQTQLRFATPAPPRIMRKASSMVSKSSKFMAPIVAA
uniref:Cell wall protein RBR3-like n=1 Tax=Diabrotica virgifera virgifera TaxID=50390 RepID=A0A6P7FWZ6_DIAVI